MEKLGFVIFLMTCMFAVTFIFGYLPNVFKQPKVINLVGITGGAFLMGAALVIVLPESVKALVDANNVSSEDAFTETMVKQTGISILAGFYSMLLI